MAKLVLLLTFQGAVVFGVRTWNHDVLTDRAQSLRTQNKLLWSEGLATHRIEDASAPYHLNSLTDTTTLLQSELCYQYQLQIVRAFRGE